MLPRAQDRTVTLIKAESDSLVQTSWDSGTDRDRVAQLEDQAAARSFGSSVEGLSPELDLSIVIPAYNEELRLPAVLGALDAHVDLGRTEVLVIDDGSTDRTAEVATELLRHYEHGRLIELPTNGGKGAAVRHGVLLATGPNVIYMDADAATELSSIDTLLEALTFADVAVGSRAHDDSVVAGSKRSRVMMGRAFNGFTRVLTGLRIRDTQCGFKAFRAPAARMLFACSSTNGFAFDVEVLANANRFGFSVVEVPVDWHHVDGSKVSSLIDPLRMSADLFRAAYRSAVFTVGGVAVGNPAMLGRESVILPHHAVVLSDDESAEVLLAGDSHQQLHATAVRFRRMGVDAEPFTREVDLKRWAHAQPSPVSRQPVPPTR
jgi:hypothetical protein